MLQPSSAPSLLPFPPSPAVAPRAVAASRTLPVLGAQKDIRYHGAPARSILNTPAATGMPFWSLNPFVGCAFGCAYCYARFAHRYVVERTRLAHDDAPFGAGDVALPPWLAFERRILVKSEAPALLRAALRPGRAAWQALVERGETLMIGSATDPYQPAERRFRVTRGVLEVLAGFEGLQVGIITKSPLITRDVELLATIARRSSLYVHVSLITVDRALARRVEPRAPTPEARLRAVRRLAAAGIDVGVNCMPVLPGLTDTTRSLRALIAAVADAGATHLNACALRLRSDARDRYLPWVAESFPELTDRYRAAYAVGHQPGEAYRDALRERVRRLCAEHDLRFGRAGEEEEESVRVRGGQLVLELA